MMRTNVPFLPQTLYVPNQGAGGFFATNQLVWDDSQQLVMPRWGITISNRIHGMISIWPGGRIIGLRRVGQHDLRHQPDGHHRRFRRVDGCKFRG
jgi:hypothetical protein